MSPPDRNVPYRFDPYLDWRDRLDYYADDPFLQRAVRRRAGDDFPRVDAAARALSAKASFRWRDLSNAIAGPESRPRLVHWDAHHHRVDRIVRQGDAEALEREVFSEGLFSAHTDPVTRLAKLYLVHQNGEAGITCPLVCTEGLADVLDRLADRPETVAIREHVREGRDGRFAIGAQFLTEIQGGSDVPANRVEAVEAGGGRFRLHGAKFFCSVAHADYAVVTAKPRGAEAVALFVMPLWAHGETGRRRNGLTIDRLKPKLGTCELPTAEITLDGAEAFALGPLDRGLATVVSVVLTASRLVVGLASAASLARAAREAAGYARFREAFGRPIGEFPMVEGQLAELSHAARRTTAGVFEVHRRYHEAAAGRAADASPAARRRAFEARELVMLQKLVTAEDATWGLREAMGILGGNGVVEDFSALPRLFRDSVVNELWEGPRNVLLAQLHRDLQKAAAWYPPGEVVASLLEGRDPAAAAELGREVAELVALPDLVTCDQRTVAACRRWEAACRALMHAFQDAALAVVEA